MNDIKNIITGFNHIITQIIEINDQIAKFPDDGNNYEYEGLLDSKSNYQSEARGAWYMLLMIDKITWKEYLYIAERIEKAQLLDYDSFVAVKKEG